MRSGKKKFSKINLYLLLITISSILILPFIYMISIALASDATSTKMTFTLFPREWQFSNFLRVYSDPRLFTWLKNSAVITAAAIVGQIFSSSLVAYGFARLRAPGKNVLFMVLLSTMMIPMQITMIPQFVLFSKLGLVNTFWPLILPNFFGHPFNVFLMRQFITQIPGSLYDAARIDGLGFFGIYKMIILPLMKPILIAIGIFTFNTNWAMFLEPLIYLNSPEKMTLSLGVRVLTETSGGAAPPWNTVMVASMLLTIPMLIVFFIGQRYIFEINFSSGSSSIK